VADQEPATAEEKEQVFDSFRDRIHTDVEEGIQSHGAKLPKMGVLFLTSSWA
jgi:hypothetical protein